MPSWASPIQVVEECREVGDTQERPKLGDWGKGDRGQVEGGQVGGARHSGMWKGLKWARCWIQGSSLGVRSPGKGGTLRCFGDSLEVGNPQGGKNGNNAKGSQLSMRVSPAS